MSEPLAAKRGRPRDPETIRRITEASGQVMLELGFERASMEQIAARAGVSKMTLYNYFPSKLALLTHCVRDKTETHFEGFDDAAFDPRDPARGLRRLANQFQGLLRDPEVLRMMGMLHGMAGQHPAVCQGYFAAGPALVMQRLRDFLQRVQAVGALDIDDVAMAANLFLGLLMGPTHVMALLGIAQPTPASDEALLDAAVRMFLARYTPAGGAHD